MSVPGCAQPLPEVGKPRHRPTRCLGGVGCLCLCLYLFVCRHLKTWTTSHQIRLSTVPREFRAGASVGLGSHMKAECCHPDPAGLVLQLAPGPLSLQVPAWLLRCFVSEPGCQRRERQGTQPEYQPCWAPRLQLSWGPGLHVAPVPGFFG